MGRVGPALTGLLLCPLCCRESNPLTKSIFDKLEKISLFTYNLELKKELGALALDII